MSFIKYFYSFIFLGLAGGGFYKIKTALSKQQTTQLTKPAPHKASDASLQMQGLMLNKPLNQNIYVEITAEQSTLFKTSKLITCEKLTSTVTNKNQKIFFNATFGTIDQLNNRITFSENFVAILKQARLEGTELVYNMSTQKLYSNQPTKFSMPKMQHYTHNCLYDIETETLVMTDGVRTILTKSIDESGN